MDVTLILFDNKLVLNFKNFFNILLEHFSMFCLIEMY